jgi:hypothetical protein
VGPGLLKPLARLAYERDGLGEDAGDDGANLLGLRLGVALDVHARDGSDGHVDGELDRVVRPHQALVALHLFGELRETALELLGVSEQVTEAAALHTGIIDSLLMPSTREIRERVAAETARRSRLAVPAFAGGFLYLLSAIIISETLNGAPTVGLLQGLAPALSGVANPAVSPRTNEVKFISHHAFPLIAGSALAAAAVTTLMLVLLLLVDATRFRRPETWPATRVLVLCGGIAVAVVSIGHQVVSAIETHNFVVSSNHTNHAVEQALTTGTANELVDYVDLFAGLALAAGVIAAMIGALRVGLLPRWMSMLGILAGVLIFLPIGGAELQVVPAFWMVMMGILYVGKWPNGEPPAWEAGEAIPWAPRGVMGPDRASKPGRPAPAGAGAAVVPAPTPVSGGSSRKRRRKR